MLVIELGLVELEVELDEPVELAIASLVVSLDLVGLVVELVAVGSKLELVVGKHTVPEKAEKIFTIITIESWEGCLFSESP